MGITGNPNFDTGSKSATGSQGEKGSDGKDGINGKDGNDGTKGEKGDQGEKGEDGSSGGSIQLIQTRSTDTKLDLQSNTSQELPLTTITDFLDADYFEVSGNGIKCKFVGIVKLNFRIG